MTDHSHHDNSVGDPKASVNPVGGRGQLRGAGRVMWLRGWSARLLLVALSAAMLFWVVGLCMAEQDSKQGDKADSPTDTSAKDKGKSESSSSANGNGPSGVLALFVRLAEAKEKDPDSAETKALERQFDEAIAAEQAKHERLSKTELAARAIEADARNAARPTDVEKVEAPASPGLKAGKAGGESAEGDVGRGREKVAGRQAGGPDKLEDELAVMQEEMLRLFNEFAAAEARDPQSAETKALKKRFDLAVARYERRMETAPSVDLSKLPGAAVRPETASKQKGKVADKVNGPSQPVAALQAEKSEEPAPSPGSEVTTPKGAEPALGGLMAAEESAAAVLPIGPASPNDVVNLEMTDNLLDLNMLLEYVGKEFNLSFLFETAEGVSGKFRMQQYGKLRRRDLMPLLESLLGFKQLAMVREGALVRIVAKAESLKKTEPPLTIGDELPILGPGETVVTQIFELEYAALADVQSLLGNFSDTSSLVAIPNTKYVIFTEYARKMPRLQEMIALVDQPGPEKRLEALELVYVQASDVVDQLAKLIKDLTDQGVGVAVEQPTRTRARRPATAPGTAKKPSEIAKEKQAAGKQDGPVRSEQGPIMHVEGRTNRILVIGTDEQIELVKELLKLLDVEEPSVDIRLVILQVEHVLAEDVASQLEQLVQALTERSTTSDYEGDDQPQPSSQERRASRTRTTRRGQESRVARDGDSGPFIMTDDRTNRILMVGTEEQTDLVTELLGLLDKPPYEYVQPTIRVYQPKHVEAAEALKIMDDLRITRPEQERPRQRARNQSSRTGASKATPQRAVPAGGDDSMGLPGAEEFEVAVATQESLNKLFVLATPPQHESIADIMFHIDVEPNDTAGERRIYFLENREPDDVASMLEDLFDAETTDSEKNTKIPGAEGAPKIVSLTDIYAVAVRGTSKQHDEIAEIIKTLDKRLAQVLVEAILVQVSAGDALDIGVSLQDSRDVGGVNNGYRRVSGISPFGFSPTLNDSGNMVTGQGGVLAFFSDERVYATLEALQTVGNTKVVSKPRIVVTDHETGSITSERQEPTTTQSRPTGSDVPIVTFDKYVKAGTTLEITPHISEGDFIKLEVSLKVDSFEGEGSGDIPPPISNNNLSTIVNVPNGMTIVLGGLARSADSLDVNKVPLLGDLPLIGFLFRSVSRSENEDVLYVFVRSQIVRSAGEDSEFQDMDRLSEPYRRRVSDSEDEYGKQHVIPGLPNPRREETPRALGDWFDGPVGKPTPDAPEE